MYDDVRFLTDIFVGTSPESHSPIRVRTPRPGIPWCLGVLPQGGAQSGAGLFLRLEECQRKEARKQAIDWGLWDRNGLHFGYPGDTTI